MNDVTQQPYENVENTGKEGNQEQVPVKPNNARTNPTRKANNLQEQARYFQSEKDKLFEENKQLKEDNAKVKKLFNQPGVEDAVRGALGKKEEKVELTQDEFDPWEAYHKPDSKSYQFRVQDEQSRIQEEVSKKVNDVVVPMQQERAVSQLRNRLSTQYHMPPEKIDRFMDFAKTPINNLGEDNIVTMFDAYEKKQGHRGVKNMQNVPNPANQVRRTQSAPSSPGVLQGQVQPKVNEADSLFNQVLGADKRGRLGLKQDK